MDIWIPAIIPKKNFSLYLFHLILIILKFLLIKFLVHTDNLKKNISKNKNL